MTATDKLAALQAEIRQEQRRPASRTRSIKPENPVQAAKRNATTSTVRRTRPAAKTGNPATDPKPTPARATRTRTAVKAAAAKAAAPRTTARAATAKPTKGTFDYAYVLEDGSSTFQVHKPGCKDLKKIQTQYTAPGLGTASSYVEMVRDLWDDQIRENDSVPDDEKTDEWVLEHYNVEINVNPCVRIPDAPKPAPSEKPKAVKAEAKRDLAIRVVEAIAEMVKGLPEDALALQGMTRDEAARCASTWVHHIPADHERWAKVLPKPDRSDWR